jgi:hypothetical protein
MNILITGVTETHTHHPDRASSTKFVSIPELMVKGLKELGHSVDHRAVIEGEDLKMYDKVFVYLYPLDHNAISPKSAVYTIEQRPDAYICLDDWSFQKLLPSWEKVVDIHDLQSRTWIAPLFPWGNTKRMGLDVEKIEAWDPSSLYNCPPVYKQIWEKRKTEWFNASLSTDAHLWTEAQHLKWPVRAVGGKLLGQERMLESQIVWAYGGYKGVLCPTYQHAGCGWWRVRYIHAARAGAILGGDPVEFEMIHPCYDLTLHEIEDMDNVLQKEIATSQAAQLAYRSDTITTTIKKLENWITK